MPGEGFSLMGLDPNFVNRLIPPGALGARPNVPPLRSATPTAPAEGGEAAPAGGNQDIGGGGTPNVNLNLNSRKVAPPNLTQQPQAGVPQLAQFMPQFAQALMQFRPFNPGGNLNRGY